MFPQFRKLELNCLPVSITEGQLTEGQLKNPRMDFLEISGIISQELWNFSYAEVFLLHRLQLSLCFP